ncbi:hypothetical protein Leryth_022467 [Lithospermum erythrorhizon]|nr:hypothetical protein Leryth_022467 [Lithospermum erythrorhizon]
MHPPAPPPSGMSKKRGLEIAHLQNQSYFKIRALLKDVLRIPDFRNSEAASEIRQKLKVLSGLYKEMTEESDQSLELKTLLILIKITSQVMFLKSHKFFLSIGYIASLLTPDIHISDPKR